MANSISTQVTAPFNGFYCFFFCFMLILIMKIQHVFPVASMSCDPVTPNKCQMVLIKRTNKAHLYFIRTRKYL